ncbi:MAG: SIMPL domain-containing protein [Anaerolineae bacterium]|nr:SIMPL domain-containing protein [Anaerolineae bacterium]
MFNAANTKRFLIVVILLMSLAISAGSVLAAPPTQESGQRTITVTGYGTAYGAPDIARVGLGVEAVNADIKAAMDDVTGRMAAVMAALTDSGVAAEDIRTEYFSIYQDYSYGAPTFGMEGEMIDPQYRVSTSITITIRNTDQVSNLIALAVDSGANIVNYIEFNIEDRATLQSDARGKAVQNAQERAAELAGLLGLTVGDALSVIENSDVYMPTGLGGGGGYAMDSAVAISEGQLSVSMSVTITFALVPAN